MPLPRGCGQQRGYQRCRLFESEPAAIQNDGSFNCGNRAGRGILRQRDRGGTGRWRAQSSRVLARVIPTNSSLRSSARSAAAAGAAPGIQSGSRPCSQPARKTTSNSRPLAACRVSRVIASARGSRVSASAPSEISVRNRSRSRPQRRASGASTSLADRTSTAVASLPGPVAASRRTAARSRPVTVTPAAGALAPVTSAPVIWPA